MAGIGRGKIASSSGGQRKVTPHWFGRSIPDFPARRPDFYIDAT